MSAAWASELADPTPTEEQCELSGGGWGWGGDNSLEFKAQDVNVSLCETEKHDVQSTKCESDTECESELASEEIKCIDGNKPTISHTNLKLQSNLQPCRAEQTCLH